MKRLLVWIVLLSLLVPVGMAAMPTQCEYAYYTARLQDWLFCGLVLVANAIMPDDGSGMPQGWG